MSSLLVTGIGELVTNDPHADGAEPGPLGLVRDAAVVVESGRVVWVGPAPAAPAADTAVGAGGRAVVPGFVDAHAHLVFAGDRAAEFEARMAGRPYAAGGIRTTVAATRAASDEDLLAVAGRLVAEMRRQGTTTVEIKSGYGLTVHDEARSLAVAATFTSETTYLGAHVVPPEFADDPAGYVDLVTGADARRLRAARPLGRRLLRARRLRRRRRARRAACRGGPRARRPGARQPARARSRRPGRRRVGAASADHCTHLTDDDVAALRDAGVVATLLPAAEFSTRSPYPDARRLLDAGRHGGAGHRLQPRARRTRRRCRSASRSPSARCG